MKNENIVIVVVICIFFVLIAVSSLTLSMPAVDKRLWQDINEYYNYSGDLVSTRVNGQIYTTSTKPNTIHRMLVLGDFDEDRALTVDEDSLNYYMKFSTDFLQSGRYYDVKITTQPDKYGDYQCPPEKGFMTTYSTGGTWYYKSMRNYFYMKAITQMNATYCDRTGPNDIFECKINVALYGDNKSICPKGVYKNVYGVVNPYEGLNCEEIVDIYGNNTLLTHNLFLRDAVIAKMSFLNYISLSEYLNACKMTESELLKLTPPPTVGPTYKSGSGSGFPNLLGNLHCIFCRM